MLEGQYRHLMLVGGLSHYCSRDLEPALAKRVAVGDACPIDLIDMEDINPNFKPRAIGFLPLQRRDINTPVCNRTKPKPTPSKGGILNFFSMSTISSSITALTIH